MIYLIGQLSIWLVLTAAFAAVAGWAFASERSAEAERALRRDRDHLIRDLTRLASEDAATSTEVSDGERETDALRRQLEIRDGRIAELEHSLETARARADDASNDAADLRRQLEQNSADSDELTRLRALAEEVEVQRSQVIDVEPEPAHGAPAPLIDEETLALQTWRLRYFEQRVQYLENLARAAPPAPEPVNTLPLEWRAREAEARAVFLENELRRAGEAPVSEVESPPPAEEPAPFASDADIDVLLRWRLLYLERRTAHLQAQLAQAGVQGESESTPQTAPALTPAPDPDRWKWRARYLEARVRHLEQRLTEARAAPAVAEALAPVAELESEGEIDALAEPEPTPPPPTVRPRGAKPPVLGSPRDGAPDDLTLIDGVSLMQQSTLYSVGVFHFDQIAAWTPENVAWVDQYLRLGGRIDEEEWVEQAELLAREGPAAARRAYEEA
jgi:predicted flap endonuclease-1-like 5' DNA nuclease